jgi:hypothetical protein
MWIAASLAVVPAQAASPVKVGELDCSVSDVDKKLFETHLVLDCSFIDSDGKKAGAYQATIDRKGLAVGNIKATEFKWIVGTLGDSENVKLDGTYVGAEVGVSVGAGGGANYLTGGFNGKLSLQPYSGEGKSGFGLDLGGQSLVLKGVSSSE